jgi:flagellar biosynthesis protein
VNSRNSRIARAGYGEQERPRAIALGYDPEKDDAPRVLASGQGVLAENIIATARSHGIPVREDPVLAVALADVQIDQVIPPELYALVAEVLAYVYRIQKRRIPEK